MLRRPYHAVQAKDLRERCDQRKINIPWLIFEFHDAQNLIRKIRRTLPEDHGLRQHLADMVTEGGEVQYSIDKDGLVDVLWLQTPLMREEIAKTRPFLFQADSTFGTNR